MGHESWTDLCGDWWEGLGWSIAMNGDINWAWHELREAGPYLPAAYAFVQEGLRRTCSVRLGMSGDGRMRNEGLEAIQSSHVSGQELCIGLRDYAVECFGPLAPVVLRHWGVKRTEDFGRIVFAMIDAGLLRKTADDSMEDFVGVFDFDEAFGNGVM